MDSLMDGLHNGLTVVRPQVPMCREKLLILTMSSAATSIITLSNQQRNLSGFV